MTFFYQLLTLFIALVVIGMVLRITYRWSFPKFIRNLWMLVIEMGLRDIDDF